MNLGIYLVTDRALCGERGVVQTVRDAVKGGVHTVQLREKHDGFDGQLRELERLAEVIDGRALLVINDRLDVTVAARQRGIPVDGVHLGQGDFAVDRARGELGPDAIVGLTANTPAHFDAVSRLPEGTVDYLGVGVIRPTSTKPNHPAALGFDGFAQLAALAPFPSVAIGGVKHGDIRGLRECGAAGVAVVSAICAARDAEAAARELVSAWNAGEVTQ